MLISFLLYEFNFRCKSFEYRTLFIICFIFYFHSYFLKSIIRTPASILAFIINSSYHFSLQLFSCLYKDMQWPLLFAERFLHPLFSDCGLKSQIEKMKLILKRSFSFDAFFKYEFFFLFNEWIFFNLSKRFEERQYFS